MGSSTFNLEQSIHDYISLIRNQGSLTNSDATELTDHLYDATEVLVKQGLSEEESFIIACKRIGNVELLTEEYSKVNISVKTNKIWVYLIVGFNLFSAIPSIVFAAVAAFYFFIHQRFDTSTAGIVILTSFHILFIAFLWYSLKYKLAVSRFIEKQAEKKPLQLIGLTLLPQVISLFGIPVLNKMIPGMSIRYPLYTFDSSWVQFTFLLAVMSLIGVALSLIFSINKAGNLTLKSLVQKPSIPFLLSFGFAVELVAASTRAIHIENVMIHGAIFGSVYMMAAFLITFYNRGSNINKYLSIAFLAGLIMEVTVGISADLDRGNTYYTVFFVSGLLAGVAIGSFLGSRFNRRLELADAV